MLLDPNGGGMALPDLRDLIESRIPDHRIQLETSYINLDKVAVFCEKNYLNQADKSIALEETKQYALQSLASVAYQINTLARDLLDMLSLQTDKINVLASNVENIKMIVNINKEKMARREIGALTANKSISKQPKIISPSCQEVIPRYKRTPIDFTLLDQVGHGVKVEVSRTGMVSRASSNLSNSNNYGYYGQYERTANISNNTLSRSSLRSGPNGKAQSDHYRVPAVMPMLDPGRYSVTNQFPFENDRNNTTTSLSNETGSILGSSEYGCTPHSSGTISNNYGTLRAHQICKASLINIDPMKPRSPELPPPPFLENRNFSQYSEGLNERKYDCSRPYTDEEPLPPPPTTIVASNEGKVEYGSEGIGYIEKAVALYDYEADKPDELTLRENCLVYILRKNDDGWFEGVLDGVTGLFPGNYVKPID